MTANNAAWVLQNGLSLEQETVLHDLYRHVVLSENGRVFFGLTEEQIKVSLIHRQSKGRLIYRRNEAGNIDCLFLWSRHKEGWEDKDWPEDDEDGDQIFLEAALAQTPAARKWGLLEFFRKEPDALWCRKVAYRQRGNRQELHEVTNKALARLLKHGKQT